MIQSNSLFCCPGHILNDTDNDDVIVLPDNIFIRLLDLDLQDEILQKTIDDEFFSKVVTSLKDHSPTPIHSALEDWSSDNGLCFTKNAVIFLMIRIYGRKLCNNTMIRLWQTTLVTLKLLNLSSAATGGQACLFL